MPYSTPHLTGHRSQQEDQVRAAVTPEILDLSTPLKQRSLGAGCSDSISFRVLVLSTLIGSASLLLWVLQLRTEPLDFRIKE